MGHRTEIEHDDRAPMRVREQAHRRGVLLGMGALILFSTSPVFGHHVASRADLLLAGYDHALGVCLIALHALMEPVHLTFHLLLGVGLLYALWDRARAWHALRCVLAAVHWKSPVPDGPLARAARAAGVPPARIREVDGLPNPAFTAGLWMPAIYVSSELARILSPDQLTAVLAHEEAHVARRDPLRLFLLRFLACTLFYLPALRRLADDASDEAEIAADDAVVANDREQSPLALAAAILQIARHWGHTTARADDIALDAGGSIVRFHHVDLLERRVRRLMGEDAAIGTHVTRRSIAGATGALAAVWLSGIMMAHPLNVATAPPAGPGIEMHAAASGSTPHSAQSSTHCEHERWATLQHLFCLGFRDLPDGSPCPHADSARSASPGTV